MTTLDPLPIGADPAELIAAADLEPGALLARIRAARPPIMDARRSLSRDAQLRDEVTVVRRAWEAVGAIGRVLDDNDPRVLAHLGSLRRALLIDRA